MMTKDEIIAYIQDFERRTEEITSSPEKARAFLKRAGILTPKGNLTKHYRSGLRKMNSNKSRQQESKATAKNSPKK